MPPHIFLILSLILVLIASLGIPRLLVRWWVARRLYGGIPFSLARHMLHYARRSPQRNVVAITGFLLVLTAVAVGLHLAFDWPLEFAIVCLAPTIYFATGTAELLLPPSVLFLSASSDQGTALFAEVADHLRFHRLVALVRPSGQLSPMMTIHLKMNIIRTINDYEWRTSVFHLMDVVPLIVMDVRETTSLLQEEIERLKRKGFQQRGLVIWRQTPVDPLPTMSSDELAERGIVIWQPNSVDSVVSAIQQKLREAVDLANRSRRQAEFAEVFSNTPRFLHDPTSAAEYVQKARAIEAFAKRRFLKDCKQSGLPANESRVFEDLPSKVTRQAEKEYLRSCRALEEVQIILRSALEDQEKSSEDYSQFNIAVARNGLGSVERLRCNWDQAIKYISDAIQRLNALLATSPPSERTMLQAELATAHFNIGDTYMGRFRDDNNEQDRQKAIRHFQETLRLDAALGADLSVTEERLRALGIA